MNCEYESSKYVQVHEVFSTKDVVTRVRRLKRELTGAKDELADVCSRVEAAANLHRSKKGQINQRTSIILKASAMLGMNFHMHVYKKLTEK